MWLNFLLSLRFLAGDGSSGGTFAVDCVARARIHPPFTVVCAYKYETAGKTFLLKKYCKTNMKNRICCFIIISPKEPSRPQSPQEKKRQFLSFHIFSFSSGLFGFNMHGSYTCIFLFEIIFIYLIININKKNWTSAGRCNGGWRGDTCKNQNRALHEHIWAFACCCCCCCCFALAHYFPSCFCCAVLMFTMHKYG